MTENDATAGRIIAQRDRMRVGWERSSRRFGAWLSTANVPDSEIRESLMAVDEDDENSQEFRPVPTPGRIKRQRAKMRAGRAAWTLFLPLAAVNALAQVPALAVPLALVAAGYVWRLGGPAGEHVDVQVDEDADEQLEQDDRAEIRAARIVREWPEAATEAKVPNVRITSHKAQPWGLTARVRFPKGLILERVMKVTPQLESALGIRRGALHWSPVASNARAAELRIVLTNPWKGTIRAELPAPGTVKAYDPWAAGQLQDGNEQLIEVAYRSLLFVGVNGSGKSRLMNGFIGRQAAAPDAVLWGIDMAQGAGQIVWEDVFDRPVVTDAAGAKLLLQDAEKVIEVGERKIGEQVRRARAAGTSAPDKLSPSTSWPALYVLIDEFPALLRKDPKLIDVLLDLGQRGRKVCVHLVIGSQDAEKDVLDKLRAELKVVIGLQVRDRTQSEVVFGQGSYRLGFCADKVSGPGGYYAKTPEIQAGVEARGYDTPPEAAAAQAARCERTRLDAARERVVRTPRAGDDQDAENAPQMPAEEPQTGNREDDEPELTEQILTALTAAGGGPLGWRDLVEATGSSRPTVYRSCADLVLTERIKPAEGGGWTLIR